MWFKPWARFITFFVGRTAARTIAPSGIPSAEAFGGLVVVASSTQRINLAGRGIGSGEAFGLLAVYIRAGHEEVLVLVDRGEQLLYLDDFSERVVEVVLALAWTLVEEGEPEQVVEVPLGEQVVHAGLPEALVEVPRAVFLVEVDLDDDERAVEVDRAEVLVEVDRAEALVEVPLVAGDEFLVEVST